MCCKSNHSHSGHHSCGCHSGSVMQNPVFWSKKKKIKMIEGHIACLEKQIDEAKEALDELNAQKK